MEIFTLLRVSEEKKFLLLIEEIVKIDNNIDISGLNLDYDEFDATDYKVLPE